MPLRSMFALLSTVTSSRVSDGGLLPWVLLAAEANASSTSDASTNSALSQFVPAVAWSAIVVQLFVMHFYQRGESLHKDYWGSGKINSAIAAIEAGRLIPSLARMFSLAASKQQDKRRRPESEMEDLLQSVEFIPDLEKAQEAMSDMNAIKKRYADLKSTASKTWKFGAMNVALSIAMPSANALLVPFDSRFKWLLLALGIGWLWSLGVAARCCWHYHNGIASFNESLELSDGGGE